jgi:hypothetical protein
VNQRIALSHQKVALFTWHGATVELEGSPDIAYAPLPPACLLGAQHALRAHPRRKRSYVASDTPMTSYLNVHAVLEERRKAARAAGPSVRRPAPAALPARALTAWCAE